MDIPTFDMDRYRSGASVSNSGHHISKQRYPLQGGDTV